MKESQNDLRTKDGKPCKGDFRSPDVRPPDLRPPDGGYGWVVVLSGFCLFMLASLLYVSYGVFFVAFLETYNTDKQTLSWLGAIITSSIGLCSMPVGAFLQNYEARKVGFVCVISLAGAFLTSSFATDVLWLFLTFGVFPGLGTSAYYSCSILTAQKYFLKKRTFAISMLVAGISVGAFVWPPLVTFLLEEYGLKGALLLLGGIQLHGFVFMALLIQPEDYYHRPRCVKYNKEVPVFDSDLKKSFQFLQTVKNLCKGTFNRQLFFNVYFLLYIIASIGLHIGHLVPYGFLPLKAVMLGIDKTKAAFLVSIFGISSGIMRPISGLIGDLSFINRSLLFGAANCLAGCVTAASYFLETYTLLAMYVAILGLVTACYITLYSLVLSDMLGIGLLAPALGASGFFGAIGDIIGYNLSGHIIKITGDPGKSFLILGLCQAFLGMPFIFYTLCGKSTTPETQEKVALEDEEVDLKKVNKLDNIIKLNEIVLSGSVTSLHIA